MRIKFFQVFAAVLCATVTLRACRLLNAAGPGTVENPTLSHCLVSLIQEAQIPAQEQGVIKSLNVREGQAVKKGEVIAQIDDAIPQAERRKALAEEKAAQEKASS